MVKIALTEAGKKWMAENYPQGLVWEYNLDDEFELVGVLSEVVEVTCPMGVPYRIPHEVGIEKAWRKAEGLMEPTVDVDERTFYEVLQRLRDVRKWSTTTRGDPWAFRQALITVMSIDTTAALERGIDPRDLKKFDMAAKEKAREFIESLPKEERTHGR